MKKNTIITSLIIIISFITILLFSITYKPTLIMYEPANLSDTSEIYVYIINIMKEVGHKIELKNLASDISELDLLNSGEIDIDPGRVAGLEKKYSNIVMVNEPSYRMIGSIYTHGDFSFNYDDMDDYRVGVIYGHIWATNAAAQYSDVAYYNNMDLAFQSLHNKGFDALFILYSPDMRHINVIIEGDNYNIVKQDVELDEIFLYMYVHKSIAYLVPKLNKAILEYRKNNPE